MNLNPYAQIILSGDFGEDWSKPFFDSIRVNQTLTLVQAERLLVDDIYNAILNNKRETENKFNISDFIGEDGVEDIESKPKDKAKRRNKKNNFGKW